MSTPFEKANQLASKLVTSLRLWELLDEIDKMTLEEREQPENKTLIELVNVLILSAPIGDMPEG